MNSSILPPQSSSPTSPTHTVYRRRWLVTQCLVGLALSILFTLAIEHSQLDVIISQSLYQGQGTWLIDKAAKLPNLLFYTLPKRLLLLLELYLIVAYLQRLLLKKNPNHWLVQQTHFFRPLSRFSRAELGYLALAMLMVPTITASLKAVTHVSCPSHLQMFDGNLPYLTIWESIIEKTHAKCFPAAHASSGFALYAWAFLPSLWHYRWQIVAVVTIVAWLMGGYKMAIGDHFFSHTLVAMTLAWTLCAGIAYWVSNYDRNY